MERTSSQNWFWPEWPCPWIRATQFSCSGWPKCENLESCGGKRVCVRLGSFHLNWPEPVLFGQPERTNGKRPNIVLPPGLILICSCKIFLYYVIGPIYMNPGWLGSGRQPGSTFCPVKHLYSYKRLTGKGWTQAGSPGSCKRAHSTARADPESLERGPEKVARKRHLCSKSCFFTVGIFLINCFKNFQQIVTGRPLI